MQPEAMRAWYAARLPSVEINNTFYRMPKTEVLQRWAQATPVAFLFENLAALGAKRGPVLFQLSPFLKKDSARLQDF